MTGQVSFSRLHPVDLLRVGSLGLRTRRMRTSLSALGIAIGIASMVAVLGISESSKAQLLAQLDRLGTNLLTVAPGQSFLGQDSQLPRRAAAMIGLIDPVQQVSAVHYLEATVRRNDFVDDAVTGGIRVMAADLQLPATLGGQMASGRYLNEATARYPTVVLGSEAATRLGIGDLSGRVRVWIDDEWFTVVGILKPVPLAPDIDTSVIVGLPVARDRLGAQDAPSKIYVRSDTDHVEDVRAVLGATAFPQHPEEVEVSRPSDALAARAEAKSAFTSLFLGLGGVALLVGAVGIANVMVISVLERRSEIGLRRALGATKRHVSLQFLSEALLLSFIGGVGGAIAGTVVTCLYALQQQWSIVVPSAAVGGAIAMAVGIGAIAGLYPARKAAGLAPTEALRTT